MTEKKTKNDIRQTYRFSKELSDNIKEEAKKRNIKPSYLVRWILTQWIAKIRDAR